MVFIQISGTETTHKKVIYFLFEIDQEGCECDHKTKNVLSNSAFLELEVFILLLLRRLIF